MSIPFDESDSTDTTTGDDAALAATQDDTTLDDPTMNDDAVHAAAFTTDEDPDSVPEVREDIPSDDLHLTDADQPVTQGESPVEAALGEDGQGDLADEDQVGAGLDDDGPSDLRTSL